MKLLRILTLGILILLEHITTESSASFPRNRAKLTKRSTKISNDTNDDKYETLTVNRETTETAIAVSKITTNIPGIHTDKKRNPNHRLTKSKSHAGAVKKSTQLQLYKRKANSLIKSKNKNTEIPVLPENEQNISNNLLNTSATYSSHLTGEETFLPRDDVNDTDTDTTNYLNFSSTSTTVITTTTTAVPVPNTESDCGGYQKADVGSISYKVGQTLSPYEGCVWIIEAGSSSRSMLAFLLRSPDSSSKTEYNLETFLSIGYFEKADYNNPDAFVWQRVESRTGVFDALVESPVAFVHFVSSPSKWQSTEAPLQGFKLDFQALRVNVGVEHCRFTNEFLRGPIGTRRYPILGKYMSEERAAFVLHPTNARSVLTIKWWVFESRSFDTLSIWYFRTDSGWKKNDTLTGWSQGPSYTRRFPVQTPRYDPILMFFVSDHSNEFDGFEFEWGGKHNDSLL